MIDWPTITTEALAGLTFISVVGAAGIKAFFYLKAQIDDNKARLDVHDDKSGIPSSQIVTKNKLLAALDPINPVPAVTSSKIP